MMIMLKVLDPRTYTSLGGRYDLLVKYDVNAIPALERYEMTYARGCCWDVIQWLFNTYEIISKDNNKAINGYTQVAIPYLAHQAYVILEYKKKASKCGMDAGSLFTTKDLARQMELCFQNFEDIQDIAPISPDLDDDLAFPSADGFEVRKYVVPQQYKRK